MANKKNPENGEVKKPRKPRVKRTTEEKIQAEMGKLAKLMTKQANSNQVKNNPDIDNIKKAIEALDNVIIELKKLRKIIKKI